MGKEKEYRRQLSKLMRLARDFPFLWHVIDEWDPDRVEVRIAFMDDQVWRQERMHLVNDRIWFKVITQGNFPVESIVEIKPGKNNEIYSFKTLKERFHHLSDVEAIEYIILDTLYQASQNRVIVIFRPLKPNKFF